LENYKLIQGTGPSNPKAFFISDYPIGDDLKSNYALSGYAYTLLSQFCNEVNLKFGDFYRTCLLKQEPLQSSSKCKSQVYLEKNRPLLEQYGPILLDEIKTLNPNLVIPLGELSFNYLTGLKGIRKFRGSVLPPSPLLELPANTKCLPILGPSPFLYQEYKLRFLTRVDFTKISLYLNDRPIPDKFYNIWVAKTASALRVFLERSYDIQKILVFDIETYFGIPTCISFCFDGLESVCVPFLDSSIDLDNRVLFINLIDRILRSPIKKVNQNIKYDYKILERWGFTINNIVGDTMLAGSCIYPEFPKNLGFYSSIYTDLPYFKDEGKEFDPTKAKRDQFYLYNAKDSLATHQIYQKQMLEIEEQGVTYVYESLMKLLPIYKKMEDRGLLVNLEIRDALQCKYENLYDIEVMKLRELTQLQYCNPLSSIQVQKVVYDTVGYKPVRGVKFNENGKPKADEDSLMLLKIFGDPVRSPNFGPLILDTIINCRKLHKVVEVLNLPLWPDNVLHCEYNLAGTETGRSTAGVTSDQLIIVDDKTIKGVNLGHSFQTIGKHGFTIDGESYGQDIRSMFIARPGFSFVEVDLSGAEARVDAVLAGISDLSYFELPGIHRLTGSWCFRCPPEEIKKGSLVPFGTTTIDRYHVAKQVRHAGERNITPEGLVTKLLWGLTVAEGATLLKLFHEKQPEMRGVYHRDVRKAIDTTHCLISPNGRRRDFFDRIDQSVYNEGYSQLPQAIVSDQTKFLGILLTAQQCPWAFPIQEAHDGSLWEVPCGREAEFIACYKSNIETPIDFRNCSLPRETQLVIPCEAEIGKNWFNMHAM
jgi:uracil-DNA glycosylase